MDLHPIQGGQKYPLSLNATVIVIRSSALLVPCLECRLVSHLTDSILATQYYTNGVVGH